MLIATLLMAAALAQAEAVLPPTDLDRFTDEAKGWLLQGRPMPPDTRLRLLRMPPEDRLQAIIFLRRAGLMTGASWQVQDLLRPGAPDEGAGE